MSTTSSTKKGFTIKRGAFINGIWHCDCGCPAERFQTKNGGPNNGKWFYTCQKGKSNGCRFFLWSDKAKVREEGAVLSNSRSEPAATSSTSFPALPRTPKKTMLTVQQPTPDTQTRRRAKVNDEDEDAFGWRTSSDEEALTKVAFQATTNLSSALPVFETPREVAKHTEHTSPNKRTHTEMLNKSTATIEVQDIADVFTTPIPSDKCRKSGLVSPSPTPAQTKSRLDQMQGEVPGPSKLAQEALDILRKNPVALLPQIERDLIDLLNNHDLRTQGIMKGRELSRLALTARERCIAELQSRIAGLEMEKETQRQVIAHLKQDMTASSSKAPNTKTPNRGRREGGFFTARRHEV